MIFLKAGKCLAAFIEGFFDRQPRRDFLDVYSVAELKGRQYSTKNAPKGVPPLGKITNIIFDRFHVRFYYHEKLVLSLLNTSEDWEQKGSTLTIHTSWSGTFEIHDLPPRT